jgi:hypothetical protein
MVPSTLKIATSLPVTVKHIPVPDGTCSNRAADLQDHLRHGLAQKADEVVVPR